MHPASITFCVTGSDHHTYVMKMPEPSAYGAVLMRESFGAGLASSLELPVPEWAPLWLDRSNAERFIYARCDQTPDVHAILREGLYFGSRAVNEGGKIYEFLASNQLRGTEVARHMARMHVFDIWTAHSQLRQYAVYKNSQDSSDLSVKFFRNSSLFSAGATSLVGDVSGINPYQRAIRLGVSPDEVDRMLDDIAGLSSDIYESIAAKIPYQWVQPQSVAALTRFLTARSAHLSRLRVSWRSAIGKS